MKKFIKYIVIFLIFGITYYFIETLYSGHSSTTSIIMGGLGGILISFVNLAYSYNTPKWKQITLTAFLMIFIELVTGLILKNFGIELWTYSGKFMNVEGIICLQYSLYWIFLSGIGIQLDDLLEYVYFDGQRPDGLVDYIKKLFTGK